MRNLPICLLASSLALVACKREKEVTVTETRSRTTSDPQPTLFATSDERFRDRKPSPVQADLPDGWRELPGSQFRMLNYRFGESGTGEVWVTLAAGSVLDNVNRWLDQFGAPPLDQAGLEKLEHADCAGGHGVWVEAEGDYNPGMNAPVRPGFGLTGVVVSVDGKILTVKMVGPRAEVAEARPALEKFVSSVRFAGE